MSRLALGFLAVLAASCGKTRPPAAAPSPDPAPSASEAPPADASSAPAAASAAPVSHAIPTACAQEGADPCVPNASADAALSAAVVAEVRAGLTIPTPQRLP